MKQIAEESDRPADPQHKPKGSIQKTPDDFCTNFPEKRRTYFLKYIDFIKKKAYNLLGIVYGYPMLTDRADPVYAESCTYIIF